MRAGEIDEVCVFHCKLVGNIVINPWELSCVAGLSHWGIFQAACHLAGGVFSPRK